MSLYDVHTYMYIEVNKEVKKAFIITVKLIIYYKTLTLGCTGKRFCFFYIVTSLIPFSFRPN